MSNEPEWSECPKQSQHLESRNIDISNEKVNNLTYNDKEIQDVPILS